LPEAEIINRANNEAAGGDSHRRNEIEGHVVFKSAYSSAECRYRFLVIRWTIFFRVSVDDNAINGLGTHFRPDQNTIKADGDGTQRRRVTCWSQLICPAEIFSANGCLRTGSAVGFTIIKAQFLD